MERLQKIISACGIASRRAAEQLIVQGRVSVNGKIAHLGDQADLNRDVVEVDGKPLQPQENYVYLMLNKPRGCVTTSRDEKGRKTVLDLIDIDVRIYPIGRLDYQSEGLLLLTNDGALTNRLTHPSHEVSKQYLVKVKGDIDSALTRLRLPFELDGRETAPADVQVLQADAVSGLLMFTIHEGRNRQIRRMCEQTGLQVIRLKRVALGRLSLDGLPGGRWRYLTEQEIKYLKSL